FDQADAAGLLTGSFAGIADLTSDASINADALDYFRLLVGNPDAELADIQAYFDGFDPANVIDSSVKFLRFQITWDRTGDSPTWSIDGLDASVVVAPQNGDWLHLQLVQDIDVAAGSDSTAADVQL